MRLVRDRLGVETKQGYGLSETSPTTHSQCWEQWNNPIGSVGPMMPNMYSKIVGDDGKELSVGEEGEIWLKGPNIMKGGLANHCQFLI